MRTVMKTDANLPIYLDYHATTPVDKQVLEAMMPFFCERFGNAASKTHIFGLQAEQAAQAAREKMAKKIGAKANEIIFTSGATEAINMAIKGVWESSKQKGCHFVTVSTEHNAVLDCFAYLEGIGATVTVVPVDSCGKVSVDDIAKAMRDDTVLVSVMMANNEIGTLQPITEIGALCHERNVLFLTDATQAMGKMPIDVKEMSIDLLAASSHKIYGPKGIGLLYVRRSAPRVKLTPLIHGGGHERGFRSGTLNIAGIVGFAEAMEICVSNMDREQLRICKLRDSLQELLTSQMPYIIVHGDAECRLANNLNVAFLGVESEAIMLSLKNDIAISSGSACTSEDVKPSHVLLALGLEEDVVYSSIRFGLGRYTSEKDIEYAGRRIVEEVVRLRDMSPRFDQVQKRYLGSVPG